MNGMGQIMVRVAAGFACSTLVAVALLHLYWVFGGRAGLSGVLPASGGKQLLHPGTFATLAVALTLFLMTMVIAIRTGWISSPPLFHAAGYGTWLIAAIFALRAIGDFRYVGFFKTVRGTIFAGRDSFIYSPLCTALAIAIAFVAAHEPLKNRTYVG